MHVAKVTCQWTGFVHGYEWLYGVLEGSHTAPAFSQDDTMKSFHTHQDSQQSQTGAGHTHKVLAIPARDLESPSLPEQSKHECLKTGQICCKLLAGNSDILGSKDGLHGRI